MALALAMGAGIGCTNARGGMPQVTADAHTSPARAHMAGNPDLPRGMPIPTGPSIIRVVNPQPRLVLVAFRSGEQMGSFFVESGDSNQYSVRNGQYQMFFIYEDEPDALYQGDDVTISNQISTITLEFVPHGNYGVRRIR
jgi:hypothetical protein